jgi:hypothetical protein
LSRVTRTNIKAVTPNEVEGSIKIPPRSGSEGTKDDCFSRFLDSADATLEMTVGMPMRYVQNDPPTPFGLWRTLSAGGTEEHRAKITVATVGYYGNNCAGLHPLGYPQSAGNGSAA